MPENNQTNLVPPQHIGDGLYMTDEHHRVAISVNHHLTKVAFIDIHDLDTAIDYLQRVKNRLKR